MIYTFSDYIFCPQCQEQGKEVKLQAYYYKVDEKVMFKRCSECLEIFGIKKQAGTIFPDGSIR